MSKTEYCYDRLVQLNDDIKDAFEELNKVQSALDRQVSAIYHELEKNEFDIEEGFTYARKLKETLQLRRVVKDEMCRLSPIYYTMRDSLVKIEEQYNKAVRKSYEIKQSLNATMTLDEVLEKLKIKNSLN